MADDSGQEKTEPATQKRMKEVRKEGSLTKSQDLSAWLGIGAAVVMMPMAASRALAAAREQFATVAHVIETPEPSLALAALGTGMGSILVSLMPVLVVVVLAAIIANAAQGGIHIAGKKLKPTFKQFNIPKGVKEKFGTQAVWQGVKAFLKTAVVGLVLYSAVTALVPVLMSAGGRSLGSLLEVAVGGINSLTRGAIAAGIALAIIDVLVIIKRNRKKTRMTKKEIKDENKATEGDPQLKGAIRSKQLSMSRNRMLTAVADADVVLVNPTHVAVALKYEPGKGAPTILATGKGHVAAKIRELASANKVPMVQDIPLARALHATCDVGDEIPGELFTAVAQVLAFVMMLKHRGGAAGQHSMATPSDIPDMPSSRAQRIRESKQAARAQTADVA